MKNSFAKFSALNVQKFEKLTSQVESKAVDMFRKSIEIAHIVRHGWKWYSALSASERETQGIGKFTADEFASKVYGIKKVMMYRYISASEVSAEVLESFVTATMEAKDRGRYASLSLADLIEFSKAKAVESEVEGEGEGEAEVGKAKTIFTLSWKDRAEGENVSVRIDADGNVTTKNTPDDIRAVIAMLSQMLPNA